MQNIAVFCGSSEGYNELYRETAFDLGAMLASRGIGIVYGGAKVGLMGAVAEAALQQGGRVTGVIPRFLEHKEIVHDGLTKLISVDTMHERKLQMNRLCDGVIALPGGWGTMEELFEMLTWGQLGLHRKPIGLLNINGFYDALLALCSNMVQEGFLDECVNTSLLASPSADELLDMMERYTPPPVPKWLTERTT
ncbi:TIGR00730 family Rossman fold protein [Nemorincola caseinilytica]|uniref:Cytokinin riboside 5'-monophosphate phosphoribohydrolase n=1 Tax=Nemorincola caseinilytica TaxID=2054315 RepID=A0ABP8NKH5_9BACT